MATLMDVLVDGGSGVEIATARVQPADAAWILTGKQET